MCASKKLICNNKLDDLLQNALNTVEKITSGDSKWRKCAVVTCKNTIGKYENAISFHAFPRDESLQNIWLDKCDIAVGSVDADLLQICSSHFTANDFEEEIGGAYRVIKPDAIPSENLPIIRIPSYESVKEHVDARDFLENKICKLKQQQFQLMEALNVCNKNVKVKKKKYLTLKNKVDRLQCNISVAHREKSLLSRVFSDAQIRVLIGKERVVWSDDDLAMAFSLRQMSSRECYLYLKRFLNFPLPALSCVQRWAASKQM